MDLVSLAIRLARTSALGSLPQITAQLLKIGNDPHIPVKQVAALIDRDPALSAKLLRLANSSYYGAQRPVRTLSQAIALLGMGTVRSLAVSTAYQQLIAHREGSTLFDRARFWVHSLVTGVIARFLGDRNGEPDPEEAFLAGLLHDVGRLVLSRFVPGELDLALRRSQEQKVPLWEAERQVLGYTHVEAGTLLGQHWSLPERLVQAIAHHHDEDLTPEPHTLAYLTRTADALAYHLGYGFSPTPWDEDRLRRWLEPAGLGEEEVETLRRAVEWELTLSQELWRAA